MNAHRSRTFLRSAAALGLALTATLAVGCSAIRSTALSWSNDDRVGDPAPALDSGEWVAAYMWDERAPTADWRLLVVFKPT